MPSWRGRRKEAETLREGLAERDVPCAFYHGDLTAEARQKAPRLKPQGRSEVGSAVFSKATIV